MSNTVSSNGHKKIAVVIGSGSIKCAAAIGMWQVLQREGIPIHMAVGSSGGSLYAAAMALGFHPQEALQLTHNFFTEDLVEGYTSNLRSAMAGQLPFSELSGLANSDLVLDRLESIYGDRRFNDARFPLFITATHLYSGEPAVISSGAILDAVRASVAIPMIFSPWQINGVWLVDGAVSNPLPVDVAIKEGADIIVAMGFELPVRTRMRSYGSVAAHYNSLYMNNILRSTFAFYNLAHHAEIIPILPEFDKNIGGFDARYTQNIITAGAQAMEEHLAYLHRLVHT